MPLGRPPKYQPLAAYLAGLPPGTTTVTLTFAEMEALLGARLPAFAFRPQFWTYADRSRPMSSQARAWQGAGWRVARFDRIARAVTFVRADTIA
jgi:hypothetical protein